MKNLVFTFTIFIGIFASTVSSAENIDEDSEVASDNRPVTAKNPQGELSKKDRRILDRGEITVGRYVAGGITGSIVGFGVGHAIQGRYPDRGWVFTAGEGASGTLLMLGIMSCFGDSPYGRTCSPPAGLIVPGLIGFLGFRIWEIVDLWVAPPQQNRRYRELKNSSTTSRDVHILPIVLQENKAGIGLAFNF